MCTLTALGPLGLAFVPGFARLGLGSRAASAFPNSAVKPLFWARLKLQTCRIFQSLNYPHGPIAHDINCLLAHLKLWLSPPRLCHAKVRVRWAIEHDGLEGAFL